MAIAAELDYKGKGATLENYWKVVKALGATPEGPHPGPGCLFHWIAEIPGGVHITDVWKTKADMNAFIARLGPIVEPLGMPEPQVRIVQLADYMTAG
jgi:hypothetical protein